MARPEAGAFGHPRHRAVDLVEALEDPREGRLRNAGARVDDAHRQPAPVRDAPSATAARTVTPPSSVNFTALPTRFVRIWRNACASPRTLRPSSSAQSDLQPYPLPRRRHLHHVGDFAENHLRGERHRLGLAVSGVDPADVDEVGDQRHLRGRRGHEQAHELPLLVVEVGDLEELGRAQHAVHRRPELVADIRQELGPAAVRRLRRDQGAFEPPRRAHGVERADGADRRRDASASASGIAALRRMLAPGCGASQTM